MRGERLVRIGALVGVGFAVAFGVALVRDPGDDLAGLLVLAIGYAAPFALALAAARVSDNGRRVAVWTGCGLLGVLWSISSMTGATLAFLVPAAIVLVGALRHARDAASRATVLDAAVAAGVLLLGASAFAAVLLLDSPTLSILGWAILGTWLLALLSMDRRRRLGVRP